MKTSIIRKADEAHERRRLFIELHTKSRFAELKLIYTIWKNKDWNVLGFERFSDYCRAPEESGGLGISAAWGIQLAETYQKFVKELRMTEKDVLEIGARKLYQIRTVVSEKNLKDWIHRAKTLALDDLTKEVKGISESSCKHEWTVLKKCRKCGIWIKVEGEKIKEK